MWVRNDPAILLVIGEVDKRQSRNRNLYLLFVTSLLSVSTINMGGGPAIAAPTAGYAHLIQDTRPWYKNPR